MVKNLFIWVLFVCLLSISTLAQRSGGGNSGRSGGRGTQPSQERQTQPTGSRQQRSPIFLNGGIVFADGTEIVQTIPVELICMGSVRRVAQSHAGQFTFDFGMGTPIGALTDASVSNIASDTEFFRGSSGGNSREGMLGYALDLTGCELRAVLPGFRSDLIQLGRRRSMDRPDVGTLVLHRLSNVKGTTVSVSSLKASKKAKKAFENAEKELKSKKVNDKKVIKELEKAVKEYPQYASAWHLLGEMYVRKNDREAARKSFRQAIGSDSQYVRPYLSLARMGMEDERWTEVAQLSGQVLEMNPYVTFAHYMSAASNYTLGKLDKAETSARKVQESNQARTFPITHFILGGILAQRGNILSASNEFRIFLKSQSSGPLADQSEQLLADWARAGLIEQAQPAGGPEK